MNKLFYFILVNAMFSKLNQACKKNEVVIRNQLGPGSILKFHCHSKDDDLGFKQLNFNAAPSVIKFHEAFGKTTQWICLFQFGKSKRISNFYEVEVYKGTFFPRCGQLRAWTAKFDGIYFTRNVDKPPERVLSWNRGTWRPPVG